MSKSLADLKTPEPKSIDLLHGKKAVVGAFTFDVIFWIEEKYGSFADFQREFLDALAEGKMPKVSELIELVFNMLENKGDFSDVREFAKHAPLGILPQLAMAIKDGMAMDFPELDDDETASAGEGEADKNPSHG